MNQMLAYAPVLAGLKPGDRGGFGQAKPVKSAGYRTIE
jgi:hypothetical protein